MSSKDPSIHAETRSAGETSAADGAKQHGKHRLEPGLHLVATPIGNLRDITLRALDTLAGADEVLAEDTRVARKLLDAHGIRAKLSAYHDHNGAERRPDLLEKLSGGATIALISDAGTPLVSDPGWKLAREALDAGIRVIPVPGASAVLAGLVASGLPSDRFMFCGFLPPKSGQRKKEAETLKSVPATLVFYEGGSRLAQCLADLADVLGANREAAVARELTKLFEETRRAPLGELADHYAKEGAPKGEIVILIGPPVAETVDAADIDAALLEAMADHPTKKAATLVADRFGLSKRDAYQRALTLKDNG
ncbi:16S rRNA (cytidine(1402)-2'-O)-methyltransferase [Henriciella aquimarina]|uniref:16S rRNA (cytidine(1402)-2'-O)-methyltransferase n=1 Tax=Henriciella aquimarina TaxID=545261 RepID=UPI000A040A04|nr:16S rRNA (cytidine(1402)-2'-O)-methyltransferase [Henriciella aquimarina]